MSYHACSMFSTRPLRTLQAIALVASPLLCGVAYWQAFAPAPGPGLYLVDADDQVRAVAGGVDEGTETMVPMFDSRQFPPIELPRIGLRPKSLYLYEPGAMSPPLDPASLAAWFFVYDRRSDREFHTAPEAMPLQISEAGDGLYRVDSLRFGMVSSRYAQLVAEANVDGTFARPGIVIVGRVVGTARRRRFLVPIEVTWR